MSLNVALLETSFEKIKPRGAEFSESFYQNLFESAPEAKPLFANTDLKEQQKKLLASLVLVVENLRNGDVLSSTLKGLGARHVQYGALPAHYPIVGGALLQTFEQYLGEDWTPEVKQSWVDAYGAVTELMLEGADYSVEEVALPSEPAPESPPQPAEPLVTEPTEEEGLNVELLESSFEKIKPLGTQFTETFYSNLFAAAPEAKPLFANTDLKEQQKKLLSSLVLVVENLRNGEVLSSTLKGLGARHVKYGALPAHYPLVGSALLQTFEQYLGSDWTPEVKQAWVDAYGAVTELMLDGADYSAEEVALPPQPTPVEESEGDRKGMLPIAGVLIGIVLLVVFLL